jgi:predicted nucleic acid-binding protein
LNRYVDTSVLAAYYCPEPLSERAERRLRALDEPIVSWLTEVELCSALAKKVRRGTLRGEDARHVQELFRVHCTQGLYRVVRVDRDAYDWARQWIAAQTTALRTLDALHLAVAHRRGWCVLTADVTMADSGIAFDVDVELLQVDTGS